MSIASGKEEEAAQQIAVANPGLRSPDSPTLYRAVSSERKYGKPVDEVTTTFKAVFSVPYAPGTLKAVGLRGDRVVAEHLLTTAGPAAKLRMTADRTVLQADGQDLSFVTVEAVEANGRPDLKADQQVQIEVSGPGVIAAVGNGDGQDPDSYRGEQRKRYQGRALVVICTSKQTGPITLTVKSTGLGDGSLTLNTKTAEPQADLH